MKIVKFKNLPLTMVGACALLGVTSQTYANSMSLSYGELKQPFIYMEQTVTFKPIGPALLMSFDLNDNWSLDFDYQSFDDALVNGNEFRSTTDLSSWGTGVTYFKDKWSLGLSYNNSTDKTYAEHARRPDEHNQKEQTDAKSFGLSAGYGWLSGEMFYNFSLSAQMSDWDTNTDETVTRPSPPPPPPPGGGEPPPPPPPPEPETEVIRDVNSGDASSLSASFSLARYWPLQDESGVLVGGMLSWNHTLSGDSVLVSSTGRRAPPNRQGGQSGGGPRGGGAGGAGNVNRAGGNSLSGVSGDDSYGQVSFYVSYDLTENWSIDFDTGVDIGTDNNDTIWSVSLGYFW